MVVFLVSNYDFRRSYFQPEGGEKLLILAAELFDVVWVLEIHSMLNDALSLGELQLLVLLGLFWSRLDLIIELARHLALTD